MRERERKFCAVDTCSVYFSKRGSKICQINLSYLTGASFLTGKRFGCELL